MNHIKECYTKNGNVLNFSQCSKRDEIALLKRINSYKYILIHIQPLLLILHLWFFQIKKHDTKNNQKSYFEHEKVTLLENGWQCAESSPTSQLTGVIGTLRTTENNNIDKKELDDMVHTNSSLTICT